MLPVCPVDLVVPDGDAEGIGAVVVGADHLPVFPVHVSTLQLLRPVIHPVQPPLCELNKQSQLIPSSHKRGTHLMFLMAHSATLLV